MAETSEIGFGRSLCIPFHHPADSVKLLNLRLKALKKDHEYHPLASSFHDPPTGFWRRGHWTHFNATSPKSVPNSSFKHLC